MKHLVNKLMTEKVPFMGDEVEVKKLSVLEVLNMQKLVTKANKAKGDEAQIDLLTSVVRLAVIGAQDITDEEFKTFPIAELSSLSNEIMRLAGLGDTDTGN